MSLYSGSSLNFDFRKAILHLKRANMPFFLSPTVIAGRLENAIVRIYHVIFNSNSGSNIDFQ